MSITEDALIERADDRAMPAGGVRFRVLNAFAILAGLTYLDRVCMSQAAGPIALELGLSETQKGLVFSAFTLAYALFEIPTGWLGDAIGPRRVLIRVVLWWSLFTALTGTATAFVPLLLMRFAFGAGEAGAFPNIARALNSWFPPAQRGRVQAVVWTSSRIGAAAAYPLTGWLIGQVGWRWTFALYGALGLVWVVPFALWYRDDPESHPSVSEHERKWLRSWGGGKAAAAGHGPTPWAAILTNRSAWGLALSTCCTAFGWYFFITWLPTYLEQARGMSKAQSSWLSSLPMVLGIAGCAAGGWISDGLVKWLGSPRYARRIVGATGHLLAGALFLAAIRVHEPVTAAVIMALAAFANDLPISSLWAASMDVGEQYAGSVSGFMCAASAVGAMVSPPLIGVLLDAGHGWTPSLIAAGSAFLLAGLFWLLVDPTRGVGARTPLAGIDD